MGKKKRTSRAEEKRAQALAQARLADSDRVETVQVMSLKDASQDLPALPALPPADRRWSLDALAWLGLGLVLLAFLIVKSFSFHWEVGDENIYLYMAWATVDHGAIPYRDYFFAHPPLHLLPGILLYSFVDITPFTARILPVGASLVSAMFLFLLARRRAGRLGAVVAAGLFLLAFDVLRASSHWTGINLSVMWLVIGLWALLRKRWLLSGLAFALGVCTGNYVLPGALMAGALALLDSRRAGLRFLLGFGVPWLLVQLAMAIAGGADYFQAVYGYHLAKPGKEGVSRDMIARVLLDNFALTLGALLGPLLAALDRWLGRGSGAPPPAAPGPLPGGWLLPRAWAWLRRALWEAEGGPARVGGLWALGYLLFILWLPRVFPFYFLLLFPGMALAGGWAAGRAARHLGGLVRAARTRGRAWWSAAIVLGALLVAVGAAYAVRSPVQRALLPRYVRGADVPMQWQDAPLPGLVNAAIRACCWDDVARARQEYGTLQEALYHESRFFQAATELGDYARAHSRPGELLFGDSSSAGLVALLAGRRLADDFADTNTLRFSSGTTSAAETIRRIDRPELRFVVVSGSPARGPGGEARVRYGMFASLPEFRRWLDAGFRVAHQVRDPAKGWFFLLERRPSG
ncbi:MAG TPA: hypothetical protein PK668_16655 [Myxococcota bacterium]|nr:hypothetical protein [Myxococcota bacterium]HRY94789.1 hypothetical protein [Myxococcota bacterium]HSA24515.1 hypothetical protein [Myxococcota bacterium]